MLWHFLEWPITFTLLNELTLPDKLFPRILITQQATNPSVISLKGTMTVFCYIPFLFFKTLFTWSGGPRSSGVNCFCFVSLRA